MFSFRTALFALPIALTMGGAAALAQDTGESSADAPQDTASTSDAPLATAMLNDGWAEARLVSAQRDGNNLTVRVRFYKAEGADGSKTIYGTLSTAIWESELYLLAGDKKYLLLKDSEGHALAPDQLKLNDDGPQAGAWTGTFPAPPAGENVTLQLPEMEPLGPFPAP